ncbi:MAG: aminotransferase class I/II-fold pyridoxal phosphate-dependent enzyme [Holophagaceae bacterium]|nr:aminotransferase class I/II-fold pyridoxal phosphate-dependent enzyme [Holophagaceae bacterium]
MDPLLSVASIALFPTKTERRANLFDKCLQFTRADELKALGSYPYHRIIENGQDTEVQVNGRKMLMLGSNSYLELTTHPRVKASAIEAIQEYGSGCAGSRFLNGTLPIHLELEKRLAALVGKEAALVFPTGFQTNTGVISTLVQNGEYIISDKLNHACIVDGCLLSPGKLVRYNHNDMSDLEDKLSRLPVDAGKLIVTDGVFSMEGDICKLPEIVRLAKLYGAQVMVDDAHGLGVLGPGGAGTAAHFGLTEGVDLIMGTFSKSLAAIGGFIASTERVINYLKHTSRPFIFSASAAPASVAAVLAALDVMQEEPERLDLLWRNATFMKQGLDNLGFDTGDSETPIIPVLMGDFDRCFQVWQFMEEEGIFVNPIVPPGVPPNRCMIRVSVTAGHTLEQLNWALEKFSEAGRRFGLTE